MTPKLRAVVASGAAHGQAGLKIRMTAAEFLAWDQHETLRREFVRGEVFAMAGREDGHATVALNIAMAFRTHLRGTPCRTFNSDVKLRVEAADCYFYPPAAPPMPPTA